MRITLEGRVLTATLDNPPDNRLNNAVFAGLTEAIDRLESEDVDLLLITGTKKVFSKGFDVNVMQACRDHAELLRDLTLTNAVFNRLADSSKPVIAAIAGACLGGGLELALACHFRLCAEKARIGLPEIWLNLVPGLGGLHRLVKLIGRAKALEMVALGDLVTADEAFRLNIVNRVFPREDFMSHVSSFVKALLMADQRVVREVIRLAACSVTQGDQDCIRQEMESFARLAPWMPK
jgi:enoyl-CoA hydratase